MGSVATIEDRIDALASASPDWLSKLRQGASAAYRELPYPVGREEVWRFTDVKAIHPDNFTLGTTTATPVLDGPGSDGVIFCDLDTAIREHDDLLKDKLGSLIGATDPFTALSLAAHSGGTFLYVPEGAEVTAPFHATHTLAPEAAGSVILPRTIVVVEDGAKVVFNDVYSSGPLGSPTLAAPVTEMFIGTGAEVGWVTWQDWGRGVKHVANVRARLDRDALLNTLVVTLGGDYSRTWKECTLAGENARSYMYGLYFSHGDQRFEHWTMQDHVAPHCTSDLLYKGALTDASQALYYGTIHIRPDAHHSDAYQANRNLALSPNARALPHPRLEIENNEVRCTHGVTVGQVSDEQLFYLESRGISPEDARRLIVFGFFNQVLDKVEWSGMAEQLADSIRAKMEV
jgi:Fe-S cluster assembly protein SufD